MNITAILSWVRRLVPVILMAVIAFQTILLWKRQHDLEAERRISSDLNQEIFEIERSIRLTERLRNYTGEITRETADLERGIEGAAGTEDRLSPDLVRVLERLRSTAPGREGSP
ncbi:MAG: hypothetical protein ACT4OK_11025 [Gemmobacter sp.]